MDGHNTLIPSLDGKYLNKGKKKTMNDERLQSLSRLCVKQYTFDDVISHLEEELIELLLAIKRVERGKESPEAFYEELIDVSIECNTVIELLSDITDCLPEMKKKKLDKFTAMLIRDKHPGKIDRYVSIEEACTK